MPLPLCHIDHIIDAHAITPTNDEIGLSRSKTSQQSHYFSFFPFPFPVDAPEASFPPVSGVEIPFVFDDHHFDAGNLLSETNKIRKGRSVRSREIGISLISPPIHLDQLSLPLPQPREEANTTPNWN